MTRTIIASLLLIFILSANAQIDRKYLYNSWTDTSKYSSDTLFYVPVANVYKLNNNTPNPEYANKVIRIVQYTADNRLIDFNYNLTTHDTVKYNLKATWKWNDDVYQPKLLIAGGEAGWTMNFELRAVIVQKDRLVLKPFSY